jgi:uroporphyrinogen-III synthase
MKNIYLLSNETIQDDSIIHLSIFDIKYTTNNIDFQLYDALLFTSKNSIYSLEATQSNYHNIPSYAIATKTANLLEKYNSNIQYIGKSSNANDFANELKDILKDKKVLYIRAKNVVSDLANILQQHNISCDELISYETICKSYSLDKTPPLHSIIIFSSPSSIRCFLNNFVWNDTYTAVCIGDTTASFLPQHIKANISERLSIKSCISLAKTL